jgi:hypothetical protein
MRNCECLKNPAVFSKLKLVFGQFMWFLAVLLFIGCTTTTETTSLPRRQADQPSGFFGKLMDEMTERECNVGRFICPYGLGPAGEPCDCTDPSGIVLKGRTVK